MGIKPLVTYGQGWAWGKGGGGSTSPYPAYHGGTQGALDSLTNAQDFYAAEGDTSRAASLGDRISGLSKKNPGLTSSVENAFTNPDGSVNWQALGGPSAQEAQHTAAHEYGRGFWPGKASADYVARMNDFRVGQAKQAEYAMKTGLTAEIDPSLQRAQTAADANLDTSAIDAGTEAAIRSRFVAAAKQDSATRLARISAGLGLGNTQNSPAALALAQNDAESADNQITSGLRDMSIQTQQMNRDQHTKDIELATRIATARYNVLNGDSKSLIGMQGDVASMIDALYSRDQTLQLQRDAAGLAGRGQNSGIATGAMTGAAGGAALGPIGAGVGLGVGAGLGYLGSR